MAVSLKRKVEAVIVELIQQSPGIPSTFSVVPFDGDAQVVTNRIVVAAEVEDDFLEGPRGYDVRVSVTLLMAKAVLMTPFFDMYCRAIQLALETQPATTPVNLSDFIYFSINDIEPEEPENTGKVRSRVINASCQVKLVHDALGVLLDDLGIPIVDDQGIPIETRP